MPKTEHTQGKWTVRKTKSNYQITTKAGFMGELICNLFSNEESEANAKRIVQTYNSHEGLLRACKYTLKTIDNPDTKFASFDDSAIKSIIKLEQAIAQAEE